MNKPESTTREHSREVECPECGAPAGEPCKRDDVASHRARHAVAIERGAPRYVRHGTGYELVSADGEVIETATGHPERSGQQR